jgi:hypothetical protein
MNKLSIHNFITGETVKKIAFKPKTHKDTFDKIDNVFSKELEDFSKYSVDDFGDRYADDKIIKKALKTNKANDVANTNPDFDPANMGVSGYTPLGDHYWLELVQRYTPTTSLRKIVSQFRFSSFTQVCNVKHSWLDYVITVDGFTHLLALYLNLRAGNVKGWHPDDWRKFPVPTYTWHTDDQSFPLRIALEINGGTQLVWDAVEHLRCKSAIARLFPTYAKSEDKLALEQVLACIVDGRSVPMSTKHHDAGKYKEVMTHVEALTKIKDMKRAKYILSNNLKYFPAERRDSGMFGFFGNIYDKKRDISKEQLDAYCYALEHCGGMKKTRLMVRDGIKKLIKMSGDNWKPAGTDDEVLAFAEFIYKYKLQGTETITDAIANYVYTDINGVKTTLIDAIRKVPDKKYSKLIDSL